MGKLILNILVVVLLLTALATVAINASFADNQITYLADDPNEDEPERVSIGSLAGCLGDDPNDEEPERLFIGSLLADDPNEDEPERVFIVGSANHLDNDPNEDEPERL